MLIVAWVVGAIGPPPGRGAREPGVRHLGRVVLERLGRSLQRPERHAQDPVGRVTAVVILVIGVGLAGLFTGNVASILVENRLRRRDVSNFEMEDHLVLCNWSPAGAGVDPRGPHQDHPGQAPGRHHPRRPRGDRPARQAGRPRLQRRLHRQGRPDQRGHPPPGPGPEGPLGRDPGRRPPGGARRRQDDPDLHRASATSARASSTPEHRRRVPQPEQPPPPASRPGPTRSSPPTSWACGCWPGRRSTTG